VDRSILEEYLEQIDTVVCSHMGVCDGGMLHGCA
jgi:hypothetical protein